jgi:cytochrome c oxidase assembly protein subunit 11
MADDAGRGRANRRLVIKLVWIVVGAVLFTIALVPLYNVLCEVTGFNGKTRGQAVQAAKSMKVNLRAA